MNTQIARIFSTIAAAALMWGCNEIDIDDRLIDLPAVESKRVVLLEEYTGQKCVNCPEAHKTVEQLLEQYPENLVAVSLHGGGDALSYGEDQYSFGLRTDESQAYCEAAAPAALPAGAVDRNSGAVTHDQWAALIRKELSKPAYIDIAIAASAADGTLDVKVDLDPHDNFNANVQVWVVEDGIIARQLMPDGKTNPVYEHNNVFRASVNGHDGEAAKLVVREGWSKEYQLKIKEKWNAANLYVVAFVYNKDGVLQAARAKVENK